MRSPVDRGQVQRCREDSGSERVSVAVQWAWDHSAVDEFAKRLVPDGLWEIVEPLIPVAPKRVQSDGIVRADDRAVFCAIVFVLTSGCAWRYLPPSFGVSHQTTYQRFTEWSEAGLWAKLHRAVLDRLGAAGNIDWSRSTPPTGDAATKLEYYSRTASVNTRRATDYGCHASVGEGEDALRVIGVCSCQESQWEPRRCSRDLLVRSSSRGS